MINAQNLNSLKIQASKLAKLNGQRPIEALQQTSQLDAEEFTLALAISVAYAPISFAQMLVLQPVFSLISFSESLQKECVLLLDENEAYIFVFADIYNQSLQSWAAQRIGLAFTTKLAHHADIAAYLAKMEEETRRVTPRLAMPPAAQMRPILPKSYR